jgi:uncharacterized protein (UPF0262 family)
MSDPGSSVPATGLEGDILAEHRVIRELTQQLEKLNGLHELLVHLTQLRPVLVAHFLKEEATDGFYEQIRAMAPRHLNLVDALQREHAAFIADMNELARQANDCLAGPVAEVLAAARALAGRLRKHETNEDDVLLEMLYTDLGQGD